MGRFRRKVERLAAGLARIDGIRVVPPAGTFYVFPDVRAGLQPAGDHLARPGALPARRAPTTRFGVACLGGECFGEAGRGFLRFSCAEPDERIDQALAFLPEALNRLGRVRRFLERYPQFVLDEPFPGV